ncbi:cell envelope biogenesis protein OmpA [Streptomyces sp. Act143]|uniref:cell envelope biogenesis protein OmpA n=1 Tax=Streptomyces sp. Act143 TaxID=2200760 RepID=UPI0028151621|nr:cell envelope biogenesis protein OmpA [Streptomyces sp. Act143]
MLLAARPIPSHAPRPLDGPRAVPAPSRGGLDGAESVTVAEVTRLRAPSPPRRPDPGAPPGTRVSDVLRIIGDSRTPVFVTVHANRPVRYGYWLPAGGVGGGCYVALPTAVCEELRAAGRIVLGEPVVDPLKTTYRVGLAAPSRQADAHRRRAA